MLSRTSVAGPGCHRIRRSLLTPAYSHQHSFHSFQPRVDRVAGASLRACGALKRRPRWRRHQLVRETASLGPSGPGSLLPKDLRPHNLRHRRQQEEEGEAAVDQHNLRLQCRSHYYQYLEHVGIVGAKEEDEARAGAGAKEDRHHPVSSAGYSCRTGNSGIVRVN